MPSDRDRLSYDPNQQYRSVVAQQGRVTVAADFNEAQEIFGEELREETLDFVGPTGTPDDGYKIYSPDSDGDFRIKAGSMYVGGMRAYLPDSVRYTKQPDWPDAPTGKGSGCELIYLRLEEREIGAVEDSSLADVALGGPDTTGRTRLIQRIVRAPVKAADCQAALKEVQTTYWLGSEGLTFDALTPTMRLKSQATLKAGFDTSGAEGGPCDPVAAGGYLGADNQLIRVRLSAANKIVWGFDNASVLYCVELVDSKTLKLPTPPVDVLHRPRAKQAVEVLLTEAELGNGEPVAYATGSVVTLQEPYDPEEQTISLPTALSAEYLTTKKSLFLRVWEEELSYTENRPVSLGHTGVNVTLKVGSPAHLEDYWAFAVRPSEPARTYPQRYTEDFQPPDGPRIWVCPLALIDWSANSVQPVDCRDQFESLVELSKRKPGCCTVVVQPSDLDDVSLQKIIDDLPSNTPARVCLSPGRYTLREPLEIRRDDLTLDACLGGVALYAKSDRDFPQGLIVLRHAGNVALRGLELRMPLTQLREKDLLGLTAREMEEALGGPKVSELLASIGIRVVGCPDLVVEKCSFVFPRKAVRLSAFGAGILATGQCPGLTLKNNRFQRVDANGKALPALESIRESFRVWVGLLLTPAVVVARLRQGLVREVAADGSIRDVTGGSIREVAPETLVREVEAETPVREVAAETAAREVAAVRPVREIAAETAVREVAAETAAREVAAVRPVREVAPETPVREVAPVTPVREVAPATPVREVAPATPVREVAPATPVRELAPETPVREVAPATLVREIAPETPIREIAPETPIREVAPETPVREIAPETPIREVAPETPVREVPGEVSVRQALLVDGLIGDALLDDAVLRDNVFTGLSAAVVVEAELGKVRLEGNTVRDSYSGFWLLPLLPVGAVTSELEKELASLNPLDFFADLVLQVGLSMGRAYSVPGEPPNSVRFSDVHYPASPPFSQEFPADWANRFFRLWTWLNAIEQPALAEMNRLEPSIQACRNQVRAVAPGREYGVSGSGPALVAWGGTVKDASASNMAVIVDANKLRTEHQHRPAVVLLCVAACSVTGNLIFNDRRSEVTISLFVHAIARGQARAPWAVAITGNVLRGWLIAPIRLWPAPLDTWEALNTVLPAWI